MRRTLRGPLGWALAAGLVIAACGGTSATPAASGPAQSAGPRLGSFDRPIILSFTPSQDTQRVTAGSNTIYFSGRIAGRRLRPGRYRALLKITDTAGNVSRVERIRFRVLRRRR